MPADGEYLKTKDAVGRASPRAGRPAAASQDNPAEQPFSLVRCRHLGPDEAWPTGLTDRPQAARTRPRRVGAFGRAGNILAFPNSFALQCADVSTPTALKK